MTSNAYESPHPAVQPADPLLRPVWEDEPDETAPLAGVGLGAAHDRLKASATAGPAGWLPADALAAVLVALCDAQDALARLDARAAAD